MTKKLKKKPIAKKGPSKTTKQKTSNKNDNFGSSGILLLGIIGIIVLMYFGLNTNIEGEKADNSTNKSKKENPKNIVEEGGGVDYD